MMRTRWRVTAIAVAMAVAGAGATPAVAQRREAALREEPGVAAQLGWGMASIGTNLGYIPAKLLYATAGGLVGLLAWGVTAGNDEVAKGILNPAFGGTWAVTPEMLRGEEPVMFNGPTYEP